MTEKLVPSPLMVLPLRLGTDKVIDIFESHFNAEGPEGEVYMKLCALVETNPLLAEVYLENLNRKRDVLIEIMMNIAHEQDIPNEKKEDGFAGSCS